MNAASVPSGLSWHDLIAWARASGAEEVWCADNSYEPIVLVSALAQLIPGKWFGIKVSLFADRPPLLAAKQLVTLDHLSQGRLVIGIDQSEIYEKIAAGMAGNYEPGPVDGAIRIRSWPAGL